MSLLGGAAKFNAAGIVPSGGPSFVSSPYSVTDFVVGGGSGDAIAGFNINPDGSISSFDTNNIGGTEVSNGSVGRWDGNNSLTKSNYQFRFDSSETPGSLSDSFNTWLSASSGIDRFSLRETAVGEQFTNPPGGTVRMRLAVSPFTEYTSAGMNIVVSREP